MSRCAVLIVAVLGTWLLSCAPGAELSTLESAPTKDRVVAFYFHGTVRCVTCLDIERVAHDTIEDRFLDRIVLGDLEWRSVDYDTATNAAFKEQFHLSIPSLVLVRFRGHEPITWTDLEETWTHVGESEAALAQYVESELQRFLDAARPKTET